MVPEVLLITPYLSMVPEILLITPYLSMVPDICLVEGSFLVYGT